MHVGIRQTVTSIPNDAIKLQSYLCLFAREKIFVLSIIQYALGNPFGERADSQQRVDAQR